MEFLIPLINKIKIFIPILISFIVGFIYLRGRGSAIKKIENSSVNELNKLQTKQIEAINNGEKVKEKLDEVKKINNSIHRDIELTRLLSTYPPEDTKTRPTPD